MHNTQCRPSHVGRGLVFFLMMAIPALCKWVYKIMRLASIAIFAPMHVAFIGITHFLEHTPWSQLHNGWTVAQLAIFLTGDIVAACVALSYLYRYARKTSRKDMLFALRVIAPTFLITAISLAIGVMLLYGLHLRVDYNQIHPLFHYAGYSPFQIACLVPADIFLCLAGLSMALVMGFMIGSAVWSTVKGLCHKGMALARLNRWKALRTGRLQGAVG